MNIELSKGEALAAIFKALGDPTRLRIFEMLRCCDREAAIDESGGCCPTAGLTVGEVCCRFGQSMSTLSFHLKELRLAGLLRTEKRGRFIYCSMNPTALALVREFLDSSTTAEESVRPAEGIRMAGTGAKRPSGCICCQDAE
jgi:ArsR family transcriptional regulator, arsenate/arsenite/antimonite-responsive transcriptional repressor